MVETAGITPFIAETVMKLDHVLFREREIEQTDSGEVVVFLHPDKVGVQFEFFAKRPMVSALQMVKASLARDLINEGEEDLLMIEIHKYEKP
jgi:hypothetical protein